MLIGGRRGYFENESGASAAEFALVILPFLALIFMIIMLSMMMYANNSLQYATEKAARCFSVNVTSCATEAATQTYAAAQYAGPDISPVFTATTAGCGHTVTGTATFDVDIIVTSLSVPLSAAACFP
jgi:Flp pilus assembly protein TadG